MTTTNAPGDPTPTRSHASRPPLGGLRFVHALAVAATVLTAFLLYVGGSVTTYRVGLAVPDWPTTFGMNMFLYDFWNAPFGVRVEHVHRLLGSAVGLATLALFVGLLVAARDRGLKLLGAAALFLVIVQGVLGGTRVTQVSTLLAAVHGFVGQVCFGLLALLVVMTGRAWVESVPAVDRGGLRRLGPILLVVTAVQAALGSWLRHYGLAAGFGLHAAGAALVLGLAAWTWLRIEGGRGELTRFVTLGRLAAGLAAFQVLLGVGAAIYLWPFDGVPRNVTFYQAVVRTLHQTTGGLLFATCVGICAWSLGRLRADGGSPGEARETVREGVLTASRADWEGVV